MPSGNIPDQNRALSLLPSVDAVLNGRVASHISSTVRHEGLVIMIRAAIADTRRALRSGTLQVEGDDSDVRSALLKEVEVQLTVNWEKSRTQSLQRVINATGVVIHTNLGRAPLSESARRAIVEEASRYCNLEYDLTTGKRGIRGARAEKMIADLTGAEDAIVVNNCAAATLLVLMSLASGGEVVISRGELVEIGGDFRIPDVMAQSGAVMREVGTTNRTRVSDYENALNENTKLILRVHTSNFRVVGFTENPAVAELVELAHRKNLVFFEDAGSGALSDLSDHGLKDEPDIKRSVADGADVVCFSGDKLLGGIQAGIIVGRLEVLERVRKHPLYRAFRVEKLVYAGIQGTLESFERGTELEDVPVLRMIATAKSDLAERTKSFLQRLKTATQNTVAAEIIEQSSAIGGGSAPGVHPETVVLRITHKKKTANEIEELLRAHKPPVTARIVDDAVLIDLRTVFDDEEKDLLDAIAGCI